MTDRYTKVVLTAIAAALVGLVLENAILPLGAQTPVQRVVICDADELNLCARVIRYRSDSPPAFVTIQPQFR